MNNHILHGFRTSTPFKEQSSVHLKDLHNLKLLTNFDANLSSFVGGLINYVLNI